MILTAQIKSKDMASAVVTVEMRSFSPLGTEEQFFLLGIDLITGSVNISNGLKQGSTQLPQVPGASPDEIEQAAAYATLSFLEKLSGDEEE